MDAREYLDLQCINSIRTLSIDAIQKANSGHPGAPLDSAAICYILWDRFLRHNPKNPAWPGRDRFILSAGHASMLLYSVLHLTGYELSLDDIKNFRQLDSKTPGHPEYNWSTPGVEVTTGPLGQGFAHGVGMAIAEKWLAEKYNINGHNLVDSYIYGMVSDGDLQEGISYEAASIAGFLKLNKLIYIYMDNDIQIEGSTRLTENEDTRTRFESVGWQVLGPVDGLDTQAISAAIEEARKSQDKPSLIICKTIIGYGSPLENNCEAHGAPLGKDNVIETKKRLGWPLEDFHVPAEVYAHMQRATERGKAAEEDWNQRFKSYQREFPEVAEELRRLLSFQQDDKWEQLLDDLAEELPGGKATRVYNGVILNKLAQKLPLIGGSADLGPSVKTIIDKEGFLSQHEFKGRNIHFGVRENAMGSIIGGMALFAGLIPYCSTFLIFVDYMRPAIRLAALMKIKTLYIYSHDSIGVGEDGPTHQPVEQLMNLRGVPNLHVIRPADAAESVEAWRAAIRRQYGPTALIFTRQNVASLNRKELGNAQGLHKGAYILWESSIEQPEIILIATGSEVGLTLEAARELAAEGRRVRVVSMPCWELFDRQGAEYKESVLPKAVRARVAVEAGLKQGWERYTGLDGEIIGMERFGNSGPAETLFAKFEITKEAVLAAARKLSGR